MKKVRKIYTLLLKELQTKQVTILNGPRQVGKTTLLNMLKNELVNNQSISPDQIHSYDLERVEDLSIWSNQPAALASLPLTDARPHYLFIDEFQHSKNIGSIIKVIHDHHPQFKIFLTGSASWYLNINESLAGRKRIITIWPLTFSEFIAWQDDPQLTLYLKIAQNNIEILTPELHQALNTAFVKFSTYGGYPAVVNTPNKKEKIELLSELLNSYLLKDIQQWNYAANTLQVKQLLTLLADSAGSLLEINTLSNNSNLSRTILENRLELLSNTFILELVKPYSTNKTKELTKRPKITLLDSGFRNMLLQQFHYESGSKAFGALVENVVLSETMKTVDVTKSVHYWRTKQKQEVDLVLKQADILTPIEIKSGSEHSIPPGLKSFIAQYNPKDAYVLNWDVVADKTIGDCTVHFRPLWFFSIVEYNNY